MGPQSVHIVNMVPSKSKYQITARATRIWEVLSTNNGKPLSLDLVLLDSQGQHIQATIPQKWIRSYKEDLHEGTIYQISHFEVAKNNKGYRPVHSNENLIRFTPFTSIISQPESSIKIEKHKFEFHRLDLIHERNNKTDYLIDVIGVLTGVENKNHVRTENGETELRNICIEDERQNEVQVTLWGDTANYVTENDTNPPGVTKTIVITSTRVARYKDEYQLKSTYGTKVYINPDIEESRTLLGGVATPKTARQLENKTQEQTEEPMQANRKTLKELNDLEISDPPQTYTCAGVITGVRTDVEWRYISCPTCRKGLDAENYCSKCNEEVLYPMQRYRILGTLNDGKTKANIVIFDKEAEKVIGRPIRQVIEIYEKDKGKQRVYDILQKCVGKEYTFKVMIGTTTYTDTRELKLVKTYVNKEPALVAKTGSAIDNKEMEPKTPDKEKRKTRAGETEDNHTKQQMEQEWQTTKRPRGDDDQANEPQEE